MTSRINAVWQGWRPLVAIVAVLTLVLAPLSAQAPFTLDNRATVAMSAMFDAATATGDPPGVVALVTSAQKTVYEHASGKLSVAGNVPMRTDALFRIHSMTKPLTSVVALMLADEKRLNLDAPVSTYLPAFATPQVITGLNADGTPQTRPAKGVLTVRHLLTHTSGVGYGFSDPTLLQLTTRTGKAEVELPLLHDPGAKWTYGASTRVLGDVIEKVTGQSLAAVLEERLFVPLGMRDTFYRVPDDKRARVMSRQQRTNGRLVEEQVSAVEESPARGDGGLYSTAADYARFIRLVLNEGIADGRSLLSRRMVRLLQENQLGRLTVTRQPDADPSRTRPFPAGAGRDTFSLAFQLAADAPRGAPVRPKGSMSWGGLRNTYFWIDPKTGLGAVLMTQVLPFYDEEVMQLLARFEEQIYSSVR